MQPSILFVDDDPSILSGLRRMLRKKRTDWNMGFIEGGPSAITRLGGERVDILVTDLRMPDADGIAVMKHAARVQPDCIRIVLSGYADLQQSIATIRLAHQYLSKPCPRDDVVGLLEDLTALRGLLAESVRSEIGMAAALPACPGTYTAVADDIEAGASAAEIATLVGRDPAVCALLLKVTNSAFVGLPRTVTSVSQAVQILGTRTVRDLVLCAGATEAMGGVSAADIDAFQRHSMLVAALAKQIAGKVPKEPLVTAAFLHDIGSLFLKVRCPELTTRAIEVAKTEGRNLVEVHRELLHVDHADIGGYLLGLWGLPLSVVEGVANHHRPLRGGGTTLGIPEIVHIADALIHKVAGATPWSSGLPLNPAVIEALGGPSALPPLVERAERIVRGS